MPQCACRPVRFNPGPGSQGPFGVRMDIYLPIAEMSVNVFGILLLGLTAGILAGMFGVGGGCILTHKNLLSVTIPC